MKYLKMLGIAAVAAMSFMAFAVSSASATTLAVTGETKNESVTITASLEKESSAILSRTDGSLANTCLESHMHGHTVAPFTVDPGAVGGPIDELSFSNCTRNPVVVHKLGSLSVSYISGSNGTVTASGQEVTVPSAFGTLNCKTGEGVDVGTLTGAASGNAKMDINAVLNCGFLVPSASWKGTYVVTSPHALAVHT